MSRIGKKPIPIPDKVKVELYGARVKVSSSDGKALELETRNVEVKIEGQTVLVSAGAEGRIGRSCHGLYRTLIANMIEGVEKGWEKTLVIEGAGYKAEHKGNQLVLTVGFTYPRPYSIPAGVDVRLTNPLTIVVRGPDKQLVGQTAASIRAVRPPDPYRGKGIRYKGERAVRKTPKGKG